MALILKGSSLVRTRLWGLEVCNSLNDRLCSVNLMLHQNSLDFVAFCIQENTADIQSFMGMLQIASFTWELSKL